MSRHELHRLWAVEENKTMDCGGSRQGIALSKIGGMCPHIVDTIKMFAQVVTASPAVSLAAILRQPAGSFSKRSAESDVLRLDHPGMKAILAESEDINISKAFDGVCSLMPESVAQRHGVECPGTRLPRCLRRPDVEI